MGEEEVRSQESAWRTCIMMQKAGKKSSAEYRLETKSLAKVDVCYLCCELHL